MLVTKGRTAALVIALSAAVGAVCACGAVLGIDDPVLREDGVDAAPSPAVDSGGSTPATDAGADTTPPREVDVEHGIFVSARTGNDSETCGAIATPCRTIQAGIEVFAKGGAGKTIVYVASARYDEVVTLASGVIVEGGWDLVGSKWLESAPGTRTVIAAPSGDRTIVAEDLAITATLRGFTIRSKALAGTGESLYGVFARGGDASATPMLRLDSVSIEITEGGNGAEGDASTGTGTLGSGSGCLDAGDGGQGSTGATGPGAEAGTWTSEGYVANNGGQGGTGSIGPNGTVEPNPPSTNCVMCNGNGGACTLSNVSKIGPRGRPGCGGGGGPGGWGGLGGGASVGVFAWNAKIEIAGARVQSSAGGRGGGGGVGGKGGAGNAGVPGNGNLDPGDLDPFDPAVWCQIGISCTGCNEPAKLLTPGQPGGDGGTGGTGGSGGGGAGGPSCAVVLLGGATLSRPSTTLVPGPGGTSTNGAVGTSAEICP